MESQNSDLHGNAPDRSSTALILIDMINDLEFEDGAALLDPAIAAAEHIRMLKVRARAAKIPVIYANDNFGRWRSDFREVVAHCLEDGVRGEPLARRLEPEPDDYFVLKPKHSAFFATTMETLLEYLDVEKLILTGISTHICVVFTAIDAFMRDYELIVPEDCVASAIRAEHDQALAYLRRVCSADTTRSDRLDPGRLRLLRARPSDRMDTGPDRPQVRD